MPIFQGFTNRVRGTVALALQEQVAADIDSLIWQILDAAIALWGENGWFTFNNDEVNCTVQLYRWCKAARRQDSRFTLLAIHFEWINVTPAILEGSEGVSSASRPDLRIEVGEIGRSIEAKRLGPTDGWPHAYVYEGLARFVVGDYGHAESVGYMVGYIQNGTVADVLEKTNQQIAGHPHMGQLHQLAVLTTGQIACWCRSSHVRAASTGAIRIDHLLVDIS